MPPTSRRRPPDILFVCTANACRSPMAQVLLQGRLGRRGIAAAVHSAGTRVVEGAPAVPHARRVVAGLDGHTTRPLTTAMLARADLVLAMAAEQVHEIEALEPAAAAWAFTLREFVALAGETGPRAAGEDFAAWVARVARARDQRAEPDAVDGHTAAGGDVDDPFGQMLMVFQRVAGELHDLVGTVADLAWPDGRAAPDDGLAPAAGARRFLARGRRAVRTAPAES